MSPHYSLYCSLACITSTDCEGRPISIYYVEGHLCSIHFYYQLGHCNSAFHVPIHSRSRYKHQQFAIGFLLSSQNNPSEQYDTPAWGGLVGQGILSPSITAHPARRYPYSGFHPHLVAMVITGSSEPICHRILL